MFVNPWGKAYGLVSGGCLESDVVHRVQRVRQSGKAEYVIYDTEDEDSFAASLGLGCNGKIGVLIQTVTPSYRALLQTLHQRMRNKEVSHLLQCYQSLQSNRLGDWVLLDQSGQILTITNPALEFSGAGITSLRNALPDKQSVQLIDDNYWSVARISSPVNLWVLGGGLDAHVARGNGVFVVAAHETGVGRGGPGVDHREPMMTDRRDIQAIPSV